MRTKELFPQSVNPLETILKIKNVMEERTWKRHAVKE